MGVFFVFIIYYLYNVYLYNDLSSFSYGSDSSFFEKILLSIQKKGDFKDAYMYEWIKQDKKIFAIYLNSIFYRLFANNVVNAILVFFFNYLIHFLLTITGILLFKNIFKEDLRTDKNYQLKIFLISFSIIGLLILPTFLRDVYILFVIIEIQYLLFYEKSNFKKWLLIILGVFILLNIRELYAYAVIAYVFLFKIFKLENLNFLKINLKKIKFYYVIIFLVLLISIIFLFDTTDFLYKIATKLLVLIEGEKDFLGSFEFLGIKYGSVQNYSLLYLFFIIFLRMLIGILRFIITPVFSQYLLYYIFSFSSNDTSFYFGTENIVVVLLSTFIFNFIIFPAIFSFIFRIRDLTKEKDKLKLNYFLFNIIMVVFTILTYSIKFLGARNQKVDYIYGFVIMITVFAKKFDKKYFALGLLFMIVLNIFGILLHFVDII
ncbi:MAG: hypothetical protein KAT68_07600 [Bacteroidales bacterium]|nr:hypothetical protein [Bacteroidales bacterium]